MLYPPSRAVSAVEPPSDPVSAPDSNQIAVSSESFDPEPSSWAIGFLVTALAVLIALLLIPLVGRIGWFTNRVLRNRTAKFEVVADRETTSGAQKDEAIAPRP